jgi:lysophospholipase L1-like esterase
VGRASAPPAGRTTGSGPGGPPRLKRIAFTIAALGFGLALALLAAEFLVRWRVEHGWRAAWRSFFSGATPFSEFATGGLLIADPELGYRYNPAYPGINSLGIRGPEPARVKPPGTKRLLVLGDSVAVPPDGFVALLARRLAPPWEVINAAVPGYTTYQERRLLERDLLPLRPDLVVLQYCLNDNHPFLHRFDAQNRMLFTEEARRALLGSGGWLARRSYLAFRLRLAWLQAVHRGGQYPWDDQPDVAVAWQDQSWPAFEQHLRAMRSQVRLVVLMAPYRPQFDPQVLARGPSHTLKPQAKMAEICDRLGVPLLDLYPALSRRGGAGLFTDHYHFNPGGHQIVAEVLAAFLARLGLVELR